jgi:hypothetical protein
VSVHQVGFNFNLYKMHGEYNIKWKPVIISVAQQPQKGLGCLDFDVSRSQTNTHTL